MSVFTHVTDRPPQTQNMIYNVTYSDAVSCDPVVTVLGGRTAENDRGEFVVRVEHLVCLPFI